MEISYDDVRKWIIANSDDRFSMDEINRLTYVFTTKYQERKSQTQA